MYMQENLESVVEHVLTVPEKTVAFVNIAETNLNLVGREGWNSVVRNESVSMLAKLRIVVRSIVTLQIYIINHITIYTV